MSKTEDVKSTALDFIKSYAREHQFFTGGDILAAFRESGLPGAEWNWRNKWGALITQGQKNEWYVKAGKVAPTSKQSHTSSLVQWQSRLFKGEQSLVGITAKDQLEAIRKDVVLRKIDLRTALWKAYEIGVEEK